MSVSQSHSSALCLQCLPDRVGDLAGTETAGRLCCLSSVVPPHIPRHPRHQLSHIGPVLWLRRLHRIKSVHVSGHSAPPNDNRIKSVSDYYLMSARLIRACEEAEVCFRARLSFTAPIPCSVQQCESSGVSQEP